MNEEIVLPRDEKMESLKNITMVVYALYAFSYFAGITAIIGIVLNYLKLEEVTGTWLESHFRWQIRTFWFGLLWAAVGIATLVLLVGFVILFVNCIWIIYRVIKGWLYFNDNKPMPL
ncbi:MAG: hypothetical protein B7Y56_00140 [Gallionellales bacterium 35-53-114]|jgi:uncharacterized membrane protein|nr:MAG: hypothetical protein B7Y56_00140 [Gallionellales bacterium 35-53-114]OYZ62249.1 MAG: hypothetical protein B7Y04_14775 [Gallionellales bacterium 24-53-125]OZB10630.1 MAG: hypothetical protein B7X61_03770 [Gallionellales bacterium 39-52-133]HQS57265.1 hypothetical protein [Gallionellaceae bacterium]HQS74547.1 hypothetical protein [Gallionellaceae bacterium]